MQSVFNGIFGDGIIKFFESMNETRLGMGDVYPSSTYSYSLDSFRFLFLGCLKSYYDELENDLQKLYLEEMDPNRIIDKNLYQSALDNFYGTGSINNICKYRNYSIMKHKVKVTVLDTKLYPEYQQRYCANPCSGKCPVLEQWGMSLSLYGMMLVMITGIAVLILCKD